MNALSGLLAWLLHMALMLASAGLYISAAGS